MVRMWMVDPRGLCRQHLLAAHNEVHKVVGYIRAGKHLDGWCRAVHYDMNAVIEPSSCREWHDALAAELQRRGYKHCSPLLDMDEAFQKLPEWIQHAKVNREYELRELCDRCLNCRERYRAISEGRDPDSVAQYRQHFIFKRVDRENSDKVTHVEQRRSLREKAADVDEGMFTSAKGAAQGDACSGWDFSDQKIAVFAPTNNSSAPENESAKVNT